MTENLIVKYVVVGLFSSWLTGCFHASAKNQSEDLSTLTADQKSSSKLTEEQAKYLERYLYRHSDLNSVDDYFFRDADYPYAKSIEDAIDIEKKYIDNNEKLKKENIKISKDLKNNFYRNIELTKQALKVNFLDKKISLNGNGEEKLTLTLWMKNDSGKDIAKVKGRLIFLNHDNQVISKFNVVNHQFIKNGKSSLWKGSTALSTDVGGLVNGKFARVSDENYKSVWVTEVIVFSDKSSLSIPE